jgi:hypothetical protein
MKTLANILCAIFIVFSLNDTDAAAHGVSSRTKTTASSFSITISAGWNLLSLPANVTNGAAQVLFPASSSPAYIYDQSYFTRDTLENGYGFWIKFSTPETISVAGDTVLDKAVAVHTGWNLIGSLSVPMPVHLIYSEPDSIISSPYYRYETASGYQVADTIQPGAGYWVKVKQDGTLFLTAPGGADGPISDSARSIVLDSINAHINALTGVNRIQDNLTILQYLRSLPEFEASDTIAGGVWARFTDGRMFMFANNLTPPDSAAGSFIEKEIPQFDIQGLAAPTDNIPFYSGAWIVNSLGPYFSPSFGYSASGTVNDLQQWFQSVGYSPLINAGATVAHLKNVSNVGVFYMSAHGFYALDRGNNSVYGVFTASKQSPLFDEVFKRDLDQGNLVYFSAPHYRLGLWSISETHYAITQKFVRRYMNFSGRSIVFVNACGSFDVDFVDACFAKGADVYVGWSMPTSNHDALRAARHFFDRLLGTNKENPENPPQRPFDVDLVMNDIILKGYNRSSTPEWGPSELKFTPTIPYTNLLVPSILQAYKDPIPGSDDFYIDGLFGDNPGAGAATIKVGGTALGLRQWVNSTKLKLDPPTHGGNVEVSVRGRKSNITQYTEWHAVFDYTLLGRGSLKKHIVFNVNFLADVHKFRINIANPPIYGPGPRYIQVLNSSHATYECSGEYKNPIDTAIVDEYWTGSGDVPIGPIGANSFSTAILDIGNPFGMYLSFSAPYDNTGSIQNLGIELSLDNFTTTMTSSYSFTAGSKQGSDGDTNTAEIFWNEITPLYPPDPNGAR